MKKKSNILGKLSFILILVTLISCKEKSTKIKIIPIKEEKSFILGIQNDENYMFYEPKDIEIQDDRYIFIADTKNKRVQKFDQNGKFIKSLVTGGEGPDQVFEPVDIEISDRNIFISDPGKRKILIFDRNERYVASLSMPYPVKNINHFQNYLYILKFSSSAQVAAFQGIPEGYLGHRLNLLNNQVDLNFCEYLKPLNQTFTSLSNFSSMDMDKNGNIWVAYNYLNKIIKFNKEGKKTKEFESIFTEKKLRPMRLKDLNPKPFPINKKIRVDENGNVYILAGISRETDKFPAFKIIFKYDNDGNYSGEMYFPYFIEDFNISKNIIYIIDEDFVIRKFKIEA